MTQQEHILLLRQRHKHMIAVGSGDGQQETEGRRWYWRRCGGVEREQGEESECTKEAKDANGEKEQEVEGQRQRGGGALKFGFRVQGEG